MANKRMFSKTIIETDFFLNLPVSSQLLYFHLSMQADDDGFVSGPKRIMRTIGASEDDLSMLLAKRFLLGFKSGVVVIKHWLIHNTIRKDRYNETTCQKELKTLCFNEYQAYTEKDGKPLVNQSETQVRLGKVRLDKVSIDKEEQNTNNMNKIFRKPSLKMVSDYCEERNSSVDPEVFFDNYESSGWIKANGQKVKNWKATIRTWERKNNKKESNKYDSMPKL